MSRSCLPIAACSIYVLLQCSISFAEPPVVPVGLDAIRQWDRWPYQRVGVRAYMRSTYDRAGGNEGADASHFLYQEREDFNVTLDVRGSGVLYFVRTNHWHGSPWHYEVDGTDHVVRETSTQDPLHPVAGSTFIPAEAFPKPLAWTWSDTKGADLSWVPIDFEKSLRLAYSRTRYGTGYYIYHQFVPGIKTSQPVKSWTPATKPDADVLDLMSRAGTDIAPPVNTGTGVRETRGTVQELAAGQAVHLTQLSPAPAMIRALKFTVPRDEATSWSTARLRVTWDDRTSASVDCPLSMLCCAGTLYNRDNREYLVKAFAASVRYSGNDVELACYFPMPFENTARLELVGAPGATLHNLRWSLRTEPLRGSMSQMGYFHATYIDHPNPEPGKDLVLLDTRDCEGSADWHGNFVGNCWIFSHTATLTTLEGDPRFFFDDSQSPQGYGTGTEEWGGGGDYWGGRNMTLPFAGHPTGAPDAKSAQCDADRIESAYRILLPDLMPFGSRARICLEHGGANESREHYESVVFWYGAPGANLLQTDSLKIGDDDSERSHGYVSPDASAPYKITSRYELGVDHAGGREVISTQSMRGRVTTGTSEFIVKLDPANCGVMLRRTLDYSHANQCASVYVADTDNASPQWKPAGTWYLAGSNSCVYSNPPGELDASQPIVQTSNRRFRDDEFLLPLDLTRGRGSIQLRLQCQPAQHGLLPGYPASEAAWSELAYGVYCYTQN